MKLLDLYCGAGGCTKGYQQAGFYVRGVDINSQPRYVGEEFVQADAIEYLKGLIDSGEIEDFSAIHASPPCQAYSAMSACRPGLANKYPAMIETVREMLAITGKPYVIENVAGAPLASAPDLFGNFGVELCGKMFGLALYRHRIFESNSPIYQPQHYRHSTPASKAGHWKPGTVISVSGNCSPINLAREAMDIDWMNREELAESIPPAYTEFIGRQLVGRLHR